MNRKINDNLELILLYGEVGNVPNDKYQLLIDERLTCGYREYARCSNKGLIVYMTPQKRLKYDWEINLPHGKDVIDLCEQNPQAKVWSITYHISKNFILRSIPNFKIHYSCSAKHSYDNLCDVSLVDTVERIVESKHRLFFKGKDPDFWKSSSDKKFDYVVCGIRNDKNQSYFINALNRVNDKRSILWIGGKAFASQIKSKHHVICTRPLGPKEVSELLPQAKIGILYSQIASEGFPQTLLEMTMCGVPVVYNGPKNYHYIHKDSVVMPKNKTDIVDRAESLLHNHDSEKCRKIAVNHYSIDKTLDFIRRLDH